MNKERFASSKPVLAFTPGALSSGDNDGLSIDTLGFKSLLIVIALTITTGEVDEIVFEESDDDSVWAAAPAQTNLFYPGSYPLTGAGAKLVDVGSVSKKRYVRVNLVASGTVSIEVDQALAVLQDSDTIPYAKEASVIADADVNSPGATADALSTPPKRTE